jgi:Xaa-Pro aminopeptidase
LRREFEKKNVSGMVIGALDEIAWLYNIRGCDVPCNPVAVSYAFVTLGL